MGPNRKPRTRPAQTVISGKGSRVTQRRREPFQKPVSEHPDSDTVKQQNKTGSISQFTQN